MDVISRGFFFYWYIFRRKGGNKAQARHTLLRIFIRVVCRLICCCAALVLRWRSNVRVGIAGLHVYINLDLNLRSILSTYTTCPGRQCCAQRNTRFRPRNDFCRRRKKRFANAFHRRREARVAGCVFSRPADYGFPNRGAGAPESGCPTLACFSPWMELTLTLTLTHVSTK